MCLLKNAKTYYFFFKKADVQIDDHDVADDKKSKCPYYPMYPAENYTSNKLTTLYNKFSIV